MSDLLKNKLSNFEVSPPAAAWTNITAELNEHKSFLPLAEKMYNYEVLPPADMWAKIPFLLKANPPAPVRKMRLLLVKLGAAAVVLGVVLVTSFYFIRQEASHQKVAGTQNDPEKPEAKKNLPEQGNHAATHPALAASLPAISFTSTPRVRTTMRDRLELERKPRVLAASTVKPDYYDINQSMNDIAVQVSLIRNERGDIIQAPRVIRSGHDNEYISVTGPNGQQTRISAKFADVLLYLNKSEHMQDEEWQKKFQDWREKIMQTSFVPSSNNFLDILELKDFILKDNQQ